jgi:hypothetical protein
VMVMMFVVTMVSPGCCSMSFLIWAKHIKCITICVKCRACGGKDRKHNESAEVDSGMYTQVYIYVVRRNDDGVRKLVMGFRNNGDRPAPCAPVLRCVSV